MKKKYCKDCKNFTLAVYDDYCAYTDYCKAKTGKIIDDPIIGKYPERMYISVDDRQYPNKIGICSYYKRKW